MFVEVWMLVARISLIQMPGKWQRDPEREDHKVTRFAFKLSIKRAASFSVAKVLSLISVPSSLSARNLPPESLAMYPRTGDKPGISPTATLPSGQFMKRLSTA
jgi:hypothetical protein